MDLDYQLSIIKSILLIFLFLYSSLITWQIYRSIKLEFFIRRTLLEGTKSCNVEELFLILRALASKKLWFNSLKLAESQISMPAEKEHHYFNALGFVYQNMEKYDLAKLYYLRSLQKQKNYPIALKNLARLNEKKKDYIY